MILDEVPVLGALGAPPGAAGAVALAATVREAVAAGVERRVLLFLPSHLAPARRRPPALAMLREGLEGLRRTSRARVFDLPRGGFAALEPPPGHHLSEAHDAIAAMLDVREAAQAVSLLRLPDQAAAVLAAVEESLGLAAAVRAVGPSPAGRAPDGAGIAQAERALLSADLTAFLRRRRVCRLTPGGGAPEPQWEDRRIVPDDVRDALLPGCDLTAAPALARRFRRALDRRLLAGLARAEELRDIGPLSLCLGLEAVTSAEFLRLDALWPTALRGALTVAIAAEEAAADPAAFAFARDLLAARGHRLLLDAAGPEAIAVLPPARAGVDLSRLRWSEALPPLGSPAAEELRGGLPAKPDSVVLAGVDRPAAIAWGWEMGITLFQGRLIENRRPVP
ncbi:hypothetical protein GXW74_11525 [Roseomonas eburnea]|uniref:EAL domain-containing protein n=1 Tax=Neoroseomonas eburnea TaxID=1346889 RepID=A0A9X9XBN3_9PROT|nr:hypothetical protein [Neoroseomonas eburnea]MBR0681119.1 hypothetical protein [Neoroseomonas eburnea]